jgi:hypothetical protein
VLNINKKLYNLNYTRKEKLSLFSFICDDEKIKKLFLNDIKSLQLFRDKLLLSQ